jgi:CheY-like chemotaxis protein
VTAHVLVVEDDPDLREVMSEALSLRGITTTVAGNGLEALERLRSAPRPALILLDLMMPVMNGFQFRAEQQAVAHLRDIPVVLLSADPALPACSAQLQAAGFLHKPVQYDELWALIQRFIL